MSPQDSMENYVAAALRAVLGAKLVLVSTEFPEERKLVTRHIEIDLKLLQ